MMNQEPVKFTILVVDDNPNNLKVVGSLLKDAGYLVGFAMNGAQALDVLQESPDIDLVLLDINMPGMNGFETFGHIRQLYTEMPVIFLTAQHGIDDIVKAFDLGAADYIAKPFNSKELLSRVSTQLQLKHKNDQLRFYTAELETFNATKDKFFSLISHDLRSPFGALHILTGLLKNSLEEVDLESSKRICGLVENTVEGGQKLLDNLLQWSRAQAGKIKVNAMEVQLSYVVEQIMHMHETKAVAKQVTMVNEVDDELTLNADIELLKTILRNLVSNAIKYSSEGGNVSVGAGLVNGAVVLSVKDSGTGMPADLSARLFRIDGDVTSNPGTEGETGTGLGLIICKEFADKMDGEIWVESVPGEGSTFYVSLPAIN